MIKNKMENQTERDILKNIAIKYKRRNKTKMEKQNKTELLKFIDNNRNDKNLSELLKDKFKLKADINKIENILNNSYSDKEIILKIMENA